MQVETNSNLNNLTSQCTESVLFIFFTSSLRHSMNSIEIPLSIFSLEIIMTSKISLPCLLYLQHKFWLKMESLLVAKISTSQMCQLLFSYVSWDKYHQTPILLWQSYSLNDVLGLGVISIFKCKCHYR